MDANLVCVGMNRNSLKQQCGDRYWVNWHKNCNDGLETNIEH